MKRRPPSRAPEEAAFSLVELLVVIAILAILAAVCLPAVNSSLRASNLNAAGEAVIDQLNFARQTALSRNLPVEFRLYKLPGYNQDSSSTPTTYRAMQAYVLDGTSSVPLSRPQYFSSPVRISTNASESPALDPLMLPETTSPAESLPVYGKNYTYRSFYFKPGGRASFLQTNVYFTLSLENDKSLSQGANYYTIQIDPLTGRPRDYRP
jgi:uncharacterized protein (TIGR02596 family)